jgi:putative two-component system response regulator
MAGEFILCVDDEQIILQSLKQELKTDPFFRDIHIELADNGPQAIKMIEDIQKDGGEIPVIVSDQRMPIMHGDKLLASAHKLSPDSLKILLTGYSDLDAVINLVNQEALYRYIPKPWDRQDLLMTIHEACRSYRQKKLIREQNKKIECLTLAMVSALESTNFYYDEETGNHIRRIALFSEFIAKKAGLDEHFVEMIKVFSPLHDIGKIGVQKDILFKPGRLTADEFAHVKEHVSIGFKILDSEGIDEIAKNIVLYHHEKWSGGGYVHNLKGKDIPLEARIVAIADVYDALISKRIYKLAYTQEQATQIILEERGKSFDPDLTDVFLEHIAAFEASQLQ